MAENVLTENVWRGRIIRYAPLILWIGLIFFLSSGQASMSETSRILRPLLEFLFPSAAEETLIAYHGFIRKFAHFAEYAVLAFWAARAFLSSPARILQKYWISFSFLVVLAVAALDETNQSFNPARTGSQWDVALDATGGAAMILAVFLYRFTFRNSRRHPRAVANL